MKTKKCLFCYKEIQGSNSDYHSTCCKKLFSKKVPPKLDFELDQVKDLAKEIIKNRLVVTGVQPKLSLGMSRERTKTGSMPRLTLIGFADDKWSDFILKPPNDAYPDLPELEDLSMHLAEVCKIRTAVHGLVKLKSNELAYICRRFDRVKGKKIPVEDMCQITEVLTERKYNSSMEKIGKAIKSFSSNPGHDLVTFYDLTLFSFLIGNSDMHLKNFSLITTEGDVSMSPAYDLLPTNLLLEGDGEQMALSVNGKKNKLTRMDFEKFADNLGIPELAVKKRFDHFKSCIELIEKKIDMSFLKEKRRDEFKGLIDNRAKVLKID